MFKHIPLFMLTETQQSFPNLIMDGKRQWKIIDPQLFSTHIYINISCYVHGKYLFLDFSQARLSLLTTKLTGYLLCLFFFSFMCHLFPVTTPVSFSPLQNPDSPNKVRNTFDHHQHRTHLTQHSKTHTETYCSILEIINW